MKKILDDTFNKINNKLPKERKLYLLAGHDLNCVFMLKLLGVYQPHMPDYGARIIFELHEINHVFGYKVRINLIFKRIVIKNQLKQKINAHRSKFKIRTSSRPDSYLVLGKLKIS